jgi:hypothetical protein
LGLLRGKIRRIRSKQGGNLKHNDDQSRPHQHRLPSASRLLFGRGELQSAERSSEIGLGLPSSVGAGAGYSLRLVEVGSSRRLVLLLVLLVLMMGVLDLLSVHSRERLGGRVEAARRARKGASGGGGVGNVLLENLLLSLLLEEGVVMVDVRLLVTRWKGFVLSGGRVRLLHRRDLGRRVFGREEEALREELVRGSVGPRSGEESCRSRSASRIDE